MLKELLFMVLEPLFQGQKDAFKKDRLINTIFHNQKDELLKSFSWWQITTASANNACIVGRVSYPAMSGCYLSGMESRPTIYFTVNN